MAPSAPNAPEKTGPAAPDVRASRQVEMYARHPPHARNFCSECCNSEIHRSGHAPDEAEMNGIGGTLRLRLREKSSNRHAFGDAPDGKDVRRGAWIDVKLAHRLVDIAKRELSHVLELRVDFLNLPEEALQILRPLEIADSDAAGV